MKLANQWRRWTMRSIHAMILGASVLGPASFARAQATSPAAAKLPQRNFARSHSFDLPLNMAPEARASVSEIRLYMKTPTSNWNLQEVGQPFLTRFVCKVPQDGEYWYSLVIVDRAGRMTPGDVNLVPPQQRVVVDTLPPALSVQTSRSADGNLLLQCSMLDTNPDPATFRAVCKTEQGDVPLEAVPNQPGFFRLKGAEAQQRVMVSAMDQAKNAVSKEVNLRSLTETTANAAPAPTPNRSSQEIALTNARPSLNEQPAPPPTLPMPRDGGDVPLLPRTEVAPKLETPPSNPPAKNEGPALPGLPNRVELPTPPPLQPLTTVSAGSAPVSNEYHVKVPAATTEIPAHGAAPYQLINTTHASVDYRLDHVGPSGVGKVEMWMTPDKGQTWHRLGEDHDKRSPAEVNLPGDGMFGIRIVITNGNGFGGRAPARGDAPHCTIEVDSTCPFVQLRSAEVLPSSGDVEIRWNAQDKNLGTAPVNLFYRTRPDSPWLVVARGVKNDGVHRWAFPREANAQFFFKIEVADQAGNVAHDVSRQPVVIDTTEPTATVVGVTGSGAVRTPHEN